MNRIKAAEILTAHRKYYIAESHLNNAPLCAALEMAINALDIGDCGYAFSISKLEQIKEDKEKSLPFLSDEGANLTKQHIHALNIAIAILSDTESWGKKITELANENRRLKLELQKTNTVSIVEKFIDNLPEIMNKVTELLPQVIEKKINEMQELKEINEDFETWDGSGD